MACAGIGADTVRGIVARDLTRDAYDGFAHVYDEFTSANNYEMWLGEVLLPELSKHGLRTGRALDIGCGTGRAFDPLLNRGWQVVGCDASQGMLGQAQRKFGDRVELIHADARALDAVMPAGDRSDAFQLTILLNEVVNYLTGDGDLERAFDAIRRHLSDDGLIVFDTNTLLWFRESFAAGRSEEMSARGWDWHGLTSEIVVGGSYEARLSGKCVEPHVHRQRHWTLERIDQALERCGLCPLATLGQREENWRVILDASPDEERDSKVVHIAGKSK